MYMYMYTYDWEYSASYSTYLKKLICTSIYTHIYIYATYVLPYRTWIKFRPFILILSIYTCGPKKVRLTFLFLFSILHRKTIYTTKTLIVTQISKNLVSKKNMLTQQGKTFPIFLLTFYTYSYLTIPNSNISLIRKVFEELFFWNRVLIWIQYNLQCTNIQIHNKINAFVKFNIIL